MCSKAAQCSLQPATSNTLNRPTCRPCTAFPLSRSCEIPFSVRSARPKSGGRVPSRGVGASCASKFKCGPQNRLCYIYIYICIYIVIVIVITTYHAVYRCYRASRTDRWFLPRSIPWVPGLPEVAHSLTEDPEDRGYRPTRLWGQWQLQSVSISNGDERWPVCSPGVRVKAWQSCSTATRKHNS